MSQQQKQQQIHPAQVACEMMNRADMKGKEVDIFAQTYNWLQAILTGELVVVTKEQYEEWTKPVEGDDGEGETPPEEPPAEDPPKPKKASKKKA